MIHPITVPELLARSIPPAEAAALRTTRRVAVGDVQVTFESRQTVLAMLHAIVATEGVSDADALQAECDVYNAFLPHPHQGISCAVQIGSCGGKAARERLAQLAGLETKVALVIGNTTHRAAFPGPLAATQHIRFALDPHAVALLADPSVEVVLRMDHPHHRHAVALSDALRRALVEDLSWNEA